MPKTFNLPIFYSKLVHLNNHIDGYLDYVEMNFKDKPFYY